MTVDELIKHIREVLTGLKRADPKDMFAAGERSAFRAVLWELERMQELERYDRR